VRSSDSQVLFSPLRQNQKFWEIGNFTSLLSKLTARPKG
jgi:hypothetical protein